MSNNQKAIVEQGSKEDVASTAEPTRKALIVAVSDYTSSLQTLDFCKKDGEETYQLLKSLGYEIIANHKLIGRVSYESMREAILDFFTDTNNKAEDTLLFYYSGHGIPDSDGDTYLASSEIDPDAPYRRGFSFNELTKMIQRSVSIRIVTILDCCYSGAAKLSKGHEEDAAKLGTVAISNKANVLEQGEGKCLLAASQAAQEAYALKEGDHSIFTYYLLEGLKGTERSVDAYGNITPNSLGNFIYRSILNLPAKKRPKQKPITKVEASGDIILASYPDLVKSKPVDNIHSNSVSSPVTETPTLPKSEAEEAGEDKRSPSSPLYPLTSSRKEEEGQKRGLGISPKILIPIIAAVAVIGGVIAFTSLVPDPPSPGNEDENQLAQQDPSSASEAQPPQSQTPSTIPEVADGNQTGGVSAGSAMNSTSEAWDINKSLYNMPPIANAGPDQTVNEGDTVRLDGSASTDPNGSISSYSWVQTAGQPIVDLSGANTPSATFLAPFTGATGGNVRVDSPLLAPTLPSNTELKFALVVTDDAGVESTADSVTVTVKPHTATTAPTQSETLTSEEQLEQLNKEFQQTNEAYNQLFQQGNNTAPNTNGTSRVGSNIRV